MASPRLLAIEARTSEVFTEVADLESVIATSQEAEKAARLAAIAEVGSPSYKFGTGAAAHRKKWKKATEDREVLLLELDALAVARSTERANEAAETLEAAIKDIRPHRKNLEKLYAEAGALLEQVGEVWLRVKNEIESFDSKVAAAHGVADAAATTNPNAHGVWNEVLFSLGDLGPLPTNVAYFAETILAAGLDPNHDYEYRVNTMNTRNVIPDLREFNVPASFSGSHLAKRGGSDFGDRIGAVAIANEPKPEPAPPSAEQLANLAKREAEEEKRFQARRAHQVAKGRYDDALPTLRATPVVDPDADPNSSGGFDPATERLARELAGVQTQ